MKSTIDELERTKRIQITEDNLIRQHRWLRADGVPCEIVEGRCIIGAWKGEPFAVFMAWVLTSNGEYMGALVTRYRGKDTTGRKPIEVLNDSNC